MSMELFRALAARTVVVVVGGGGLHPPTRLRPRDQNEINTPEMFIIERYVHKIAPFRPTASHTDRARCRWSSLARWPRGGWSRDHYYGHVATIIRQSPTKCS